MAELPEIVSSAIASRIGSEASTRTVTVTDVMRRGAGGFRVYCEYVSPDDSSAVFAFKVLVDSLGVLMDDPADLFPDCIRYPERCEVRLTSEDAIAAALDWGLEPTDEGYLVEFKLFRIERENADEARCSFRGSRWMEAGGFAWHIRQSRLTPRETRSPLIILVDARTGDVVGELGEISH